MVSMSARTNLVHPSEIVPKCLIPSLNRSRVTCAHFLGLNNIDIHDAWQLSHQRQLPFWSGDLFF